VDVNRVVFSISFRTQNKEHFKSDRILFARLSLAHIHPQGLTSAFKNTLVSGETTETSKYLLFSQNTRTKYYEVGDDENVGLGLNLFLIL
jgi:hypothetical protein